MENKYNKQKIIVYSVGAIIAILAVILLCFVIYSKERQKSIILKSQFTYSIRMQNDGTVIPDEDGLESGDEKAIAVNIEARNNNFEGVELVTIAKQWTKNFVNQFTQPFIARSRGMYNAKIDEVKVLNQSQDIVLVKFSSELKNSESDYFSSWDGHMEDGRFVCEWVVDFEIEDLYDGTARIYVKDIEKPEDYGLATYNKRITENQEVQSDSKMYYCEIRNEKLYVTYDGGEKWVTVPVDYSALKSDNQTSIESVTVDNDDDKKTTLENSRFQIGNEKTVFLYGGNTVKGHSIPLTIVYSNDKGNSWTNVEIASISGAHYYYIRFFDAKSGVILVTYNSGIQEKVMVFATSDGGENWKEIERNTSLSHVKAALFVDKNIGFIQYEYTKQMDSNLYITKNSGVSYEALVLEPQQLDAGTKLQWNEVYTDIQIPVKTSTGDLYLLVKQGEGVNYNGGNLAARYESKDEGLTWKYVDQVSLADSSNK